MLLGHLYECNMAPINRHQCKTKMTKIMSTLPIARQPRIYTRFGNEFIHRLTTEGAPVALRVELEDFDGVMAFAEYETFRWKLNLHHIMSMSDNLP